jgi:hypothetical protein
MIALESFSGQVLLGLTRRSRVMEPIMDLTLVELDTCVMNVAAFQSAHEILVEERMRKTDIASSDNEYPVCSRC